MKIHLTILTTVLYLATSLTAYASSQLPETTVFASPDKVVSWFQYRFANAGIYLKSSNPGVAIFESPSKQSTAKEQFLMSLSNVLIGNGLSLNRITINTMPGRQEGVTRVMLIEEHIMSEGTPMQRIQGFPPGSAEYNSLIQLLSIMKKEVEPVEVSPEPEVPTGNAYYPKRLIDYPAGKKPFQPLTP